MGLLGAWHSLGQGHPSSSSLVAPVPPLKGSTGDEKEGSVVLITGTSIPRGLQHAESPHWAGFRTEGF